MHKNSCILFCTTHIILHLQWFQMWKDAGFVCAVNCGRRFVDDNSLPTHLSLATLYYISITGLKVDGECNTKKTIINNFSTSQPYRRVGERLFKWQENGMIPTIKFSFMLLLLLPAVRNLSKQSCEFQKSWMKINSIYTNRMPYCCTTLLNGGAKMSFFHLIIHLQTFKDGIPSLSKPWCKSYSRS